MNRTELRHLLIGRFSLSELRDLCYLLKIDYESLPAEGKAGKARELVMFAERREKTPDLIYAVANFQPAVPSEECPYCGMKKCGCGATG